MAIDLDQIRDKVVDKANELKDGVTEKIHDIQHDPQGQAQKVGDTVKEKAALAKDKVSDAVRGD